MLKRIILSILLILSTNFLFAFDSIVSNENKTGFNLQISNESEPGLEQDILVDSTFVLNLAGSDYIKSDNLLFPIWSFRIALPELQLPIVSVTNIQLANFKIDDAKIKLQIIDNINSQIFKVSHLGLAGKTPTITLQIFPIQLDSDQLKYIKEISISLKYASPYPQEISLTNKRNSAYINKYSAPRFTYQSENLKKVATPSFPSGNWYRLTISDENILTGYNNQSSTQNIFKLSYDDLESAGITESAIQKNRIFLYSNENSGRNITDFNTHPIVENARFFKNSNSSFSSGDYIYFYGNSPSGIVLDKYKNIEFSRNPYSFENYYWLFIADDEGNPKAVESFSSETSTANYELTTTDYLYRKEREKGSDNILKSGNDWYGKLLDGKGSSASETFSLPSSDNDYYADIEIRLKSGTEKATQYYQVSLNNNIVSNSTTRNYSAGLIPLNKYLKPGNNVFSIKFHDGSGKGYLDYIQCKYDVTLDANLDNCLFFAPKQSGVIEYQIKNDYAKEFEIFDITDKTNIKKLDIATNTALVKFRQTNSSTSPKEYLMTSESDYSSITEIESVDNPDFSSLYNPKDAQYIIITDESLISAADYIAEIHNSKVKSEDQLSTFVTTQSEIFRQFNGDVRDPEAIRSFLHYAYENWTIKPQYVLLLGDGSYDHRQIEADTKNLVMTYQVKYTDAGYDYYSTDFRFTYLAGDDMYPDIAIGRVPASDLAEANNYAAKLENYLINPNFGEWRHTFSLVADDPEDPDTRQIQFTRDSETLTKSILPDIFTYNKLYLLEYPDSQDDSKYGRSKPAATEAILAALKTGTSIINYMGHGAPTIWSQENAFTSEQLPEIDNATKLPLWIAGTCTWGKFDEIYDDCMPENLMTMNKDGGIAAIGATRPTYLTNNFNFLTSLFNHWFADNSVNRIRLGEVIENNLDGTDRNDEKYILFGDPALYISLPYKKGDFESLPQDTLKALQNIKVSGNTEDTDFNGNAIVSLFDSKQAVTRYYVDRYNIQQSYSYSLPGDLLFKGNVKVENGQFQSSFYIPKDLNYSNNFGKLHVYGWNDETQQEFSGVYNSIIFSGSENVSDSIGPKVEFLKNDQVLYDGGLVGSEDQLNLKLTDPHGINLTGKMGHGISVIIDDNDAEDLTANFSYSENSDTSGILTIPFDDIEFGNHDITVKAWDNANNSTERNFNFTYQKSEEFNISKIVNYPNPFKNTTDITFYSSELCEFSIAIYTVNGLKIREFESLQSSADGFTKVYWDGKDDFGDTISRGIYFYKINAKSMVTNQKDNYIGKLVKS